ncbi:MAG TPA: IclR family transcriptional regulator [Cellulomonadaceae bacterium]|nr:IclR family transcriptional regulator [Cellulomonadaceae bacterium]
MAQTVSNAIEILEFVSARPRTPGEVALLLGVHRSTALRLLQTLTTGGLTRRRPDGRYGIGYRLVGLAQRAKDQFDLQAIAHPHLTTLTGISGFTTHLAALEGVDIVYIDKVEPSGSVRLYSEIGKPVPLHTASAAKAVLAGLPRERTLELLEGWEYRKYTSTTITSKAALLAELDRAQKRGWAVDDGEFEDFVNCIAYPVRAESGDVIGAVSITALRVISDLATLESLVPDLIRTCEAISREVRGVRGTLAGV